MKVLKNMRYVAFGLVVLLGVVGQAEASGVRNRLTNIRSTIGTSMENARMKVVDSGRKFLGLKSRNQNSNVAQNSPVVSSSSMSMQNDGDMSVADSSSIATPVMSPSAAPSPAMGWKAKLGKIGAKTRQALTPGYSLRQSTRPLVAEYRTLGAQRQDQKLSGEERIEVGNSANAIAAKLDKKIKNSAVAHFMTTSRVVPSYLSKKYVGVADDHRFFGNTRDAISGKYNQLKSRFRSNQQPEAGAEGIDQGAQTSRLARLRDGAGKLGGSIQEGFKGIGTSVSSGFSRMGTALTPSDETQRKAKAMLKKLKPERAMTALAKVREGLTPGKDSRLRPSNWRKTDAVEEEMTVTDVDMPPVTSVSQSTRRQLPAEIPSDHEMPVMATLD